MATLSHFVGIRFLGFLYCSLQIMPAYSFPHSFHEIKQKFDSSVAYYFGKEKVRQSNESTIHQIIQELQMIDSNIEIRKMNEFSIAHAGRENAFVLSFINYLFISEEFFDELSYQEKRFLIGHELMHIYNNHGAKRYGLLATALSGALLFEEWLSEPYRSNKLKNFGINNIGSHCYYLGRGSLPFITVTAAILSSFYLARQQEFQADLDVIDKLGESVIPGAISLLERFENLCGSSSHVNSLMRYFTSQPSFKERLDNIKCKYPSIDR